MLYIWQWSSQEDNKKLLESKLEGDSLEENFGKLLLSGDTVHIGCNSNLAYPPDQGKFNYRAVWTACIQD